MFCQLAQRPLPQTTIMLPDMDALEASLLNTSGTVKHVYVSAGDPIEVSDLLVELE